MPITAAADLIDALREYRILDAAQLDKITRAMKGRSPDPRAVARELLKNNWITAFQANQLLQGHGAELVLGPYLLLDRLGEGGMGQVFKARHQLMNRIVAIKVIRKERLAHPDAVERFHREIRMAAQLDHPNLVRAHDASQVGDTHFLVMEYAEGSDLFQLVRKSGPLPVGQACSYIRQAALGLQHASERGLVHRDIKPSNLQVTAQGRTVKVLDMGLARSQTPDGSEQGRPELTQACTIMGTPDYIAPEQIADPRCVDVRADIYSLGCTFYFMLAGRPPFPTTAWEEKLVCHRKVEAQAIEQIRADVPAGVGAVLRKMMAKRPADRYAAPAAVADALTSFSGMSVPALIPMPVTVAVETPAGGQESGWTLGPNSTLDPALGVTNPGYSPTPPLGATMLIPGQHSGQHSAPPTARSHKWVWLGLMGCGGAVMSLTILLLILFWPKSGETNKKGNEQRAEVTKDSADGNDKNTLKEPPSNLPRILVDEDFRAPYEKKLTIPENWEEGEAFRVIKDNEKHALEVGKPTGLHFVKLPPVTLNGDFYIEGIYALILHTHKLTISLESRQKSALLTVVFDWDGKVLIDNDARLAPADYVHLKPTHFLLRREGKRLRVFLDKAPVADKALDDIADYDTVRLGLTAGAGFRNRTARLYGIKVGTLSEGGQVPPSNMKVPDVGGPRRGKKK
ncbi:MAG TPA: serine/threonine-protein kinase [Gemmataceae bacterium]|nr:serine/threonine-protein kinase [Gemmataceae bacterium]